MSSSLTPQQIKTANSIADYLWLSWFQCDELFNDNWINFAVARDDPKKFLIKGSIYGKVLLGLFIKPDGKPVIDKLSISQQTLVIDACRFITSLTSIVGKDQPRDVTARRILSNKI